SCQVAVAASTEHGRSTVRDSGFTAHDRTRNQQPSAHRGVDIPNPTQHQNTQSRRAVRARSPPIPAGPPRGWNRTRAGPGAAGPSVLPRPVAKLGETPRAGSAAAQAATTTPPDLRTGALIR